MWTTMARFLLGGRMIDFPLSNMSHCIFFKITIMNM